MNPPNQQRQLKHWITDYVSAVDKISESPTLFHLWTAISVVSAVLKDNVWVDMGTYKIKPNQFIVLVGPPGIGKGNAIHAANVYARNPPNTVPLAHYVMDAITTAKMIEILSKGFPRVIFPNGHMISTKEASCILQVSEFPVLFDNNYGMTNFLCEAWSRDEYNYSTKNGGNQIIKDLCLSLIAACVPDFVKDINKSKNAPISNGLTSRMIFVYADKKSKNIVWPKNNGMSIISPMLSNDLEIISRLNGEFTFTDSARILYENEYLSLGSNDDDSEVVANFKARQSSHIMKTAMALSAASRDDLVIDDFAMGFSIKLIDSVAKTLDLTFRGIGDSNLAIAQDRIMRYMERKGVAAQNEILKDNYRHITAEDLERILTVLKSIDFIDRYNQGGKAYCKHIGKGGGNP